MEEKTENAPYYCDLPPMLLFSANLKSRKSIASLFNEPNLPTRT
jgi:hypothetical protein